MKKTRYLAGLFGLALCLSIMIPTAYCSSRTYQSNPPQAHVWYTDSDDAIVASVEDGQVYTVHIQIASARSHHGLTLTLSRDLLGEGLVAEKNHKPVSYNFELADEVGPLMMAYEHFTLSKDKDYAIAMKYVPGSAVLECLNPKEIPDEELFVIGATIGNISNDGTLRGGDSCVVTFRVQVERVPEEPAKQPSPSSTQDSGFLNFTFSFWDLALFIIVAYLFYIAYDHARTLDKYRGLIDECRRQPEPAAPEQPDPEVQIDINHMPKPMQVNFDEDETVSTGATSDSAEVPEAPVEGAPDAEESAANGTLTVEGDATDAEEPVSGELPAADEGTQGDISTAERDQIEQMCDELEERMKPTPDPLHPDGET